MALLFIFVNLIRKCAVFLMQVKLSNSCSPVFLLLPLMFPASAGLRSPVKCSSDETACEVHEETLIESVGGVATREECRQLCYDSLHCQYSGQT